MLLVSSVIAAAIETQSLDSLVFYEPSLVSAEDHYRTAIVKVHSLNDKLWAAANSTVPESPFIHVDHGPGMESVLNVSAPVCSKIYTNLTNSNGVATLPTGAGLLQAVNGLSYDECVSHCCNSIDCVAWDWYSTTDEGFLCQTLKEGYTTGPQPWPQGHVLFAQGGVLKRPASEVDEVANGLRSGTYLGGIGTGGYEIRADGTFHLDTIRNQAPAAEPWQGIVRDCALAVSINGKANVVRLKPFGNLSGVPSIVYSDMFPITRWGLCCNYTSILGGLCSLTSLC
jgi:hypothetical protein